MTVKLSKSSQFVRQAIALTNYTRPISDAAVKSSVHTEQSSPLDPSKLAEKLAQAPESELISPVVPLENGST